MSTLSALSRAADCSAKAAYYRERASGHPCPDAIADLWRDVQRQLDRQPHASELYVAPPESAAWVGVTAEVEARGQVYAVEVTGRLLTELRVSVRRVDRPAWEAA